MKRLECVAFHHDIGRLKPVISEIGFDIHYNKIYRQHVDDFNNGDGDFVYNKSAAHLHELYFENIRERRENNVPTGKVQTLIENRYGTFENFCKTVIDKAETLQGSGWVFMNKSGYVNIIPNNRMVDHVALIVDCWEHAYAYTHGHDKKAYIQSFFEVINWEVVNSRLVSD